MANRFQELIEEIPTGTFYRRTGEILPKRSDPYKFRFDTGTPTQRFGIFVNSGYRGIVDTDANGIAVVTVSLDEGRQDIELVDEDTQSKFRAYITIRNFATWMIAHADVFEDVDTKIQEERDSLAIETATQLYLGDIYGRPLRQPNDAGYLTDAYRFVLQEMRQGYRLWGARVAGVRQIVHAMTASSPLRVPKAWRPNWALGDQLHPAGDLDNFTALLDDDTFPLLNIRSTDFILSGAPDNVSPAAEPYATPPDPQPLTVTFDAAYIAGAAGDVVIEGLDQGGLDISDTFLKPGVAGTVQGVFQQRFADITAIRLTALGAGAGTFGVGLAESRFVKLVSVTGPHVRTGTSVARTIDFYDDSVLILDFDVLALNNGNFVELYESGRYTLGGDFGYFGTPGLAEARIDGVKIVTPAGGTVDYADRDRLYVMIDDFALVTARLPPAPATLASVASAVDLALRNELSLGANRALGTIFVNTPGSIVEGQTIAITDGLGNVLTLEADTDDTVTAGNVPFDFSSLNADTIADQIRFQINLSGVLIHAIQNPSVTSSCLLDAQIGGASSNVAIVNGVAGISVLGMSGGSDAPLQYQSRAAVISHALIGDILQISGGIGALPPNGMVRLEPKPVDGAYDVMGFPRGRSALAAAGARRDTTLDCSGLGTDKIPLLPPIVLHPTLSSDSATGQIVTPDGPTMLAGGNGQSFTLEDSEGTTQLFEFFFGGPFTPTAGAITVNANGFDADTVANNIISAINGAAIKITASPGTPFTIVSAAVDLVQDIPGTAGNTTISETVVSGSFSVTSFSGGVGNQNAPGPFTQPDWATPAEVWFSADYSGGDVILDGVDCEGNAVFETIEAPAEKLIIDSGERATLDPSLQSDGRAANSPGGLATQLIGTADGAASEIEIWHLTPGTAGNTTTVSVVTTGSPNQPLLIFFLFGNLTIQLGTDFIAQPDPAKNNAREIARRITESTLNYIASPTGAGTGALGNLSLQAPAAFAGGVDDGHAVELSNKRGRPNEESFSADVKPGMIFRLTSGVYSGEERRIIHVSQGASVFPPDGFDLYGVTPYEGNYLKITLESAMPGSFLNASWEVCAPQVVKGEQLFKTITSMANTQVNVVGKYQLRIADGVENYGIPMIVGRGLRDSGSDGVILGPFSFIGDIGAFSSASYVPHPDDFKGIMRIANSTGWAGQNNGLHEIYRLDPLLVDLGSPGLAFLKHEFWPVGGRFNLAPATPTDWSSFVQDTGLDWFVYASGETVIMVANDRNTGTLEIAEPGLNNNKIIGAQVEVAGEMPHERRVLERGLDQMVVDVDLRLTPNSLFISQPLTVRQRIIPDGWRLYNIDESASLISVWGRTNTLRLMLVTDGGSAFGEGMIVEHEIPRALEYKGFTLRIAFWFEQMIRPSEDFRVDVSWDGGNTWSLGSATPIEGHVSELPASVGHGGGDPIRLGRDVVVPTDVTKVLVRLVHVITGARIANELMYLEKVIVTATHAQGFFLGSNTVARHETHEEFGEMLYVWSPESLLAIERSNLGLPDPATKETITVDQGHVDRGVNAHGFWERVDVSEYDAFDNPINILGIYDEGHWLTCTLINMRLVVQTPGRLSYVEPEIPSLIEGEVLQFIAPSNATLSNTSRHEGLLPQPAELRDQLYQDGAPVPQTPYPGTRATATIGAALGVNGTILVTVDAPGIAGNAHTIEVNAAVGTDRILTVTYDPLTGTVLVNLAARDGALLTDENRAFIVAGLIDALEGITATHLPGNGTASLNAAEGPTAFTGAQATPWRFIAADEIQIASTLAGDSADVAFYAEGIHGAPGTTPVYDPASEYTLDYEALIRAESPALDLGASHADYLWLIDAAIYRRVEPSIVENDRTGVNVLFRSDFTAELPEPSTQDQTLSRLFRDTGLVREEIPVADWSYIDARTIQLDAGQFDDQAIYTLEYVAQTGRFERVADFVIEHRSATSELGVAAQPWRAVEIDERVGRPQVGAPHQWHQIRVTITNVLDVRDIRLKSMGFKGIRLYGANPKAPGIITCDEE